MVNACTTLDVRAHISCYTSAQQLLCGRRYKITQKHILSFPTIYHYYTNDKPKRPVKTKALNPLLLPLQGEFYCTYISILQQPSIP